LAGSPRTGNHKLSIPSDPGNITYSFGSNLLTAFKNRRTFLATQQTAEHRAAVAVISADFGAGLKARPGLFRISASGFAGV